jgi:uncharacterized protein (TIGR02271 family)
MDEQSTEKIIPVIDEELIIDRQTVKTGAVRVEKRVTEHVEHFDISLLRERVEVRRVPVNRIVEAMPATREEGDTIIVPVVEEEIEVKKRLILKEELHIVRRREREPSHQEVTVRHEEANLIRTDAAGQEIEKQRKSILERHPRRLRR